MYWTHIKRSERPTNITDKYCNCNILLVVGGLLRKPEYHQDISYYYIIYLYIPSKIMVNRSTFLLFKREQFNISEVTTWTLIGFYTWLLLLKTKPKSRDKLKNHMGSLKRSDKGNERSKNIYIYIKKAQWQWRNVRLVGQFDFIEKKWICSTSIMTHLNILWIFNSTPHTELTKICVGPKQEDHTILGYALQKKTSILLYLWVKRIRPFSFYNCRYA